MGRGAATGEPREGGFSLQVNPTERELEPDPTADESGTRDSRLPSLGLRTSSAGASSELKRPAIKFLTEGYLGGFNLGEAVTVEAIGLPAFVVIRIAPGEA